MSSKDVPPKRKFDITPFDFDPKPVKSFVAKFINERVASTRLTESQIVFLAMLDEEKGMSLREMTDTVGVHKSLTTRAVKHLAENGFVINTSESGKEYSIVLTPKGAEAKEVALAAFNELFRLLMQEVTEEEFVVFEAVMSKVKRRMIELSVKE